MSKLCKYELCRVTMLFKFTLVVDMFYIILHNSIFILVSIEHYALSLEYRTIYLHFYISDMNDLILTVIILFLRNSTIFIQLIVLAIWHEQLSVWTDFKILLTNFVGGQSLILKETLPMIYSVDNQTLTVEDH